MVRQVRLSFGYRQMKEASSEEIRQTRLQRKNAHSRSETSSGIRYIQLAPWSLPVLHCHIHQSVNLYEYL